MKQTTLFWLFISFFFVLLSSLQAKDKYKDNYSCSECHEKIYEEYKSSYHSHGYFNDILHRKIADKVSIKKYDCATCHMPMANNLKDIVTGKARPDKNNKTHTDAVSCYFCHTIAYVKKAHRFNINVKAKQAENYKPSLYGRLENPDHNDKHSSVKNPIYAKKVCTGCHSYKLNENNVTIFHAMNEKQNSEECIKCHMPEVQGGADKINKRARMHHASHKFLGIHDASFRKKGVDINVTAEGDSVKIMMHNKMPHPLIIQSARAKYLKIEIRRKNKILWRNYQMDPREDKQSYFASSFTKEGKPIVIPYHATAGKIHNLAAKETKTLHYKTPLLKKEDTIMVNFYVQLAKKDCAQAVKLDGTDLMKPMLIKKVILKL